MREPSSQDALFAWYYAALKHGAGSPQAPIHADEPRCGYFRVKAKNGIALPAYIAMEQPKDENGKLAGDETLICQISNVVRDPYAAWTYLAGHPVPYPAFKQAWETGKWPDDAPGENFQASDTLEGLTDQLKSMVENAAAFKTITTQTQCDQAANLKDRLMQVHKALDDMRIAEKRPHDEAAMAVQNKFRKWLAEAFDAVDALRIAMKPFMEQAQEAAKRAAVEAGGEGAAAAISIRASAGGMGGRRTSTRKSKVPVIVNYKTAAIAVIDEPEVMAAVDKAVKRWFREGKTAPGVEVREETKVI